jgi:Domain of unknown function (DUF4124)
MLGACASASSATVYKWVDDNGVTHYSDQPNPKAQKLEVADAQTYGSKQATLAVPPAAASASAPAAAAAPAVCMIDSPGAGQVFLDTFAISGHVTLAHVGAGTQPTLTLDGQDISGDLQPDGSFMIPQVERGDHTLSLQVSGCQGNTVGFSIRQRSAGGTNTLPMAPTVPGAPKAPGVGTTH